jgi:hypothetical protein
MVVMAMTTVVMMATALMMTMLRKGVGHGRVPPAAV